MTARIAKLQVQTLIVEDTCPKCGEATATDCGDLDGDDLPYVVELGCDDCETEWMVTLSTQLAPKLEIAAAS